MPHLGHGVGLRREHFDTVWAALDGIDFFEILSENFMGFGGRPRAMVERAAAERPVVLHGVSLSIGSLDPLDGDYLAELTALARRLRPLWFSDHLCSSSAHGVHYHDLVPLPFTAEAVEHVVRRVRQVQDRVGLPFLLENPSYYIHYATSEMSEAEFIRAIVEEADCGLLLDVNNVYVNATNHGYDPRAFIDALPLERVAQLHMAGHEVEPELVIDTHGAPVCDEVLALYQYTVARTGPVATLLERDHAIPPIEELVAECARIRALAAAVWGEAAPWRP